MEKIVFASQNKNKLSEIKSLLSTHFEILSLTDVGHLDELDEDGKTLAKNALQKARFISQKYNVNCFSDDSGLEVTALDNEPGVDSAHYAGPQRNAEDNMQLLLSRLGDSTNRDARFKTCIALCFRGQDYIFEGVVEGKITNEKRGNNGFGYDPIFRPNESHLTFGEMTLEEKQQWSHRAKATQQLKAFLLAHSFKTIR